MNTSMHSTFDPLNATGERVSLHGWAWDEAAPHAGLAPLNISIWINGAAQKTVVANVTRDDIVAAGVAPSPDHGFEAVVSVPSSGTVRISVYVEHCPSAGGAQRELEGSPQCLRDGVVSPCPTDDGDLGWLEL